MKLDREALDRLPNVISKEQLRIVGHMSKRTATYLLESKLIPAIHKRQKTRSYYIKKQDVIEFFEDIQRNPDKYIRPDNWYSNENKKAVSIRCLPTDGYDVDKLREYYKMKFKAYKGNILSVEEVSEFTGYRHSTITQWIRDGKLEALIMPNRYVIPKELLMRWLLSEQYNSLERKTKKHVRALFGCDWYIEICTVLFDANSINSALGRWLRAIYMDFTYS